MKLYDIWLSPPEQSGTEAAWLQKVLDSNWITTAGPLLEQFEKEIADFTGRKYALTLQSGTAAIHLSCLLSGVKPNTDVIIPSLTFAATAFPVSYIGANPVFVDVEKDTWNISANWLETAILGQQKKGKTVSAVIAVDLFGFPANYSLLTKVCEKYQIPLISDAAESLGSSLNGSQTGSFGKFSIFSFNGNKIVTTGGGGMLLTDDFDAWNHAKKLASQAKEPVSWYEHKEIGFNYRMSHTAAALGLAQFHDLQRKLDSKQRIYQKYLEKLSHILDFKTVPENIFCNQWLVTALLPESLQALDLVQFLFEQKIEARQVWKPLHTQPVFEHCAYYGSDLPEHLFKQGICLPSGAGLTENQQDRVIEAILKFGTKKII